MFRPANDGSSATADVFRRGRGTDGAENRVARNDSRISITAGSGQPLFPSETRRDKVRPRTSESMTRPRNNTPCLSPSLSISPSSVALLPPVNQASRETSMVRESEAIMPPVTRVLVRKSGPISTATDAILSLIGFGAWATISIPRTYRASSPRSVSCTRDLLFDDDARAEYNRKSGDLDLGDQVSD